MRNYRKKYVVTKILCMSNSENLPDIPLPFQMSGERIFHSSSGWKHPVTGNGFWTHPTSESMRTMAEGKCLGSVYGTMNELVPTVLCQYIWIDGLTGFTSEINYAIHNHTSHIWVPHISVSSPLQTHIWYMIPCSELQIIYSFSRSHPLLGRGDHHPDFLHTTWHFGHFFSLYHLEVFFCSLSLFHFFSFMQFTSLSIHPSTLHPSIWTLKIYGHLPYLWRNHFVPHPSL